MIATQWDYDEEAFCMLFKNFTNKNATEKVTIKERLA